MSWSVREAAKNPFIFTQINDYLAEGNYAELSPKKKIGCFFPIYEICKKVSAN